MSGQIIHEWADDIRWPDNWDVHWILDLSHDPPRLLSDGAYYSDKLGECSEVHLTPEVIEALRANLLTGLSIADEPPLIRTDPDLGLTPEGKAEVHRIAAEHARRKEQALLDQMRSD